MKDKFLQSAFTLTIVCSLGIGVFGIIEQFRNPDLTETRLFLNHWQLYTASLVVITGLGSYVVLKR